MKKPAKMPMKKSSREETKEAYKAAKSGKKC